MNNLKMLKLLVLTLLCLSIQATAKPVSDKDEDEDMHPSVRAGPDKSTQKERTHKYWITNARKTIEEHLATKINTNIAKNVILFMGDGMSIPTLTATRVALGNENIKLSFEKFPFVALAKTYCVNTLVPDSACTSTAYLGGVKGSYGTIGVTGAVKEKDCKAMTNKAEHVQSIAQWFQLKGKSTGSVTNTRVTHASPAGLFGHTAFRKWESDTATLENEGDPKVCMDLATQLVTEEVGKNLKVIMGGGGKHFYPKGFTGEDGYKGYRSDGVNLVEKWKKLKEKEKAKYVWNRNQLLALKQKDVDYLFGMFAEDHMSYNKQREEKREPTLTEMTEAAIKILSKNSNGYFLFVEGGEIDMAHHENWPRIALAETIEFAKAIERAVKMTSEEDTLIVVTADHAHTLVINGYPDRGADIFGFAGESGSDNLSYTILSYGTGLGYKPRSDLKLEVHRNKDDWRYPTTFPHGTAAHGGDDVAVYAKGPYAHLFQGSIEQTVIPHIMAYASCVAKEGSTACTDKGRGASAGTAVHAHFFIIVLLIVVLIFYLNST